jgi:hypothetical protein
MMRLVAVVIAALKVSNSVVGFVRLAAVAVMAGRFVVYAGTPLRATGWLSTTVIVFVDFVALTMLTGVAGAGRFGPFLRVFPRCVSCRRPKSPADMVVSESRR